MAAAVASEAWWTMIVRFPCVAALWRKRVTSLQNRGLRNSISSRMGFWGDDPWRVALFPAVDVDAESAAADVSLLSGVWRRRQ